MAHHRDDAVRYLHECTALEYILLGDLREILEEPIDAQNRKWLLAVLDALLDTIPREMELQRDGGYLADVIEEFPNWSPIVGQLQERQERLYRDLGRLRDRAAWDEPVEEIAGDVRRELQQWMHGFAAHQRHQRRILQTAFNLDVGAGD